MRRWPHRGGAAVLLTALRLLTPLGLAAPLGLLAPALAEAQSVVDPAGPPRPSVLARLELRDLSPRVVTATSAPMLRVSGRVVNVGNRPITQLSVGVRRDEPVSSETAAQQVLQGLATGSSSGSPSGSPAGPPRTGHLPTGLRSLPGALAPGQSRAFDYQLPLGGEERTSLHLTTPGVYPVLVTLSGKPGASELRQLASVPLLLPVLGLPPPAPDEPPGPTLPRPPQPAPLTVLWPLVAVPQRLPNSPGKPAVVQGEWDGTDRLAAEVTPGGRLDGLLGALEQAVPPGSPLGAAVCVAVDPLLLETLDAMSHGYQVASPERISAGTGAQSARRWLQRLRSAVQGRCVLPLPYADADLAALSRARLTDLEALATSTGAHLVSELLGVQPLSGVSWPAGEMLDERTLADLTALHTHAVLLDPHSIAPPAPTGSDVVSLVQGSPHAAPVGLLTDPLLTGALARGANPLSAQDGLGLLVDRAASGRGILLVPPRRWQATGTEATTLLTTARQLLQTGFVTPRELAALANTRPTGATGALSSPPQASTGEIPPQVTTEIKRDRDVLHDLQVSTVLDPAPNLKPATLLDPLRLGLLRGVSTAWRQAPLGAVMMTRENSEALEKLRASVQIVRSPGPYTLGSSDSPLLITVGNELPVGMQVTLSLSQTAGLRAGSVGPQLVPARSTRQLVIPAQVSRAGKFSVTVRLSTPGGTSLGEPSKLQLRSTAFGTMTVVLTASAGAMLVLLVAQRIVRRARRARKVSTARQAEKAG